MVKKAVKNEPVVQFHGEDELFEHVTEHGTIRLPFLENVPMGILEDNTGKPQAAFITQIIMEFSDEEAVRARRAMTIREFNEMITAWQDQSALKLGELVS
ncbi:hypothetical protein [Trueperella sp. LYQ143]|uniref:hypothetical protein n=1 Tax=unclassified Trueperella TaxID=2630174 RepID=UPI0039830413